ncbi:hypothetical protein TNIN_416301 [Trichonephila inaurata madagascariensis]|uniref:Uncharacterized protein n=1 Tax=Trichonephila inaurata madagascariensis TaxID=2747483 RepID=A0A8X6Y3F3_9ARAC|nr:hypothetical protein TNIN_416301 [Trichonephila inaurata madagascariensis]
MLQKLSETSLQHLDTAQQTSVPFDVGMQSSNQVKKVSQMQNGNSCGQRISLSDSRANLGKTVKDNEEEQRITPTIVYQTFH